MRNCRCCTQKYEMKQLHLEGHDIPRCVFLQSSGVGLVPLRRTRGLRSVAKKGKAPRQGSHIPKAQSHRFLPSGFLPPDLHGDSFARMVTRTDAELAFPGYGAQLHGKKSRITYKWQCGLDSTAVSSAADCVVQPPLGPNLLSENYERTKICSRSAPERRKRARKYCQMPRNF